MQAFAMGADYRRETKSRRNNYHATFQVERHSDPPLAASAPAAAGARQITEQLITDAGYNPVPPGGLDKARAVEDLSWPPVTP